MEIGDGASKKQTDKEKKIMWTRKDLKQKAKAALKRNYWKAVLVCLLLMLLGGGGYSASSGNGGAVGAVNTTEITTTEDADEAYDDVRFQTGSMVVAEKIGETVTEAITEVGETFDNMTEEESTAIMVAFVITFIILFIVVFVIAFAFSAFIYNPILIGTNRFMLKSVEDKGKLSELAYAFDHSYMNNVKTMFVRDIVVFLWSLLFVIPGIYKSYQYKMVPYLLAENPDMPYKEVLKRSTDMMNGNKWKAFVLDLSFILWSTLGIFTCGLLDILFTKPYIELTRAALYRELSGKTEDVQTVEAITMQEVQ